MQKLKTSVNTVVRGGFREKYTPKGIVFVPTYNCTGMCPHCNIDFNKHNLQNRMDIKKAIKLLYKSKEIGLNSIQFTGGEITMYPEFMPGIIPHAKKLAIRVNKPPTNCYIGKSAEQSACFFRELKSVNYTSGFRISIDPYHGKKIPLDWVVRFTVEYGKFFRFSSLTIGSCYYDRDEIMKLYRDFAGKLKQNGLRAEIRGKYILINGQKVKFGIWKPTRPSWRELPDNEVELKKIEKTMACLGPGGVGYLWVEPDFKVRVCSGNGNGFLDYYLTGDLSKESLNGVIERAGRDEIFKILANYGAAGLRQVLNYKENILDENKKYTFMCELCNEIAGNKEYRRIVRDNYKEIFK